MQEKVPEWASGVPFEEPPHSKETESFELALPCFALAKSRRKNPVTCSEEIKDLLDCHRDELGLEDVRVLKAFVNLRFKKEALGRDVIAFEESPLGQAAKSLQGETFVVDFSSPNIAKPFGIGHLRSTNIGAALCRMVEALGGVVVRVNHLGDWGTQFGKMITAYKRFGSAQFVKGDPVNNLYKLYVEFHQKEASDPALLDEAREWFVRLEQGDPEATELWTWFKDVSFHEFKKIYDRLGVSFDYVTGESFYNKLMEKTADDLKSKGLLKESEGALVVDLEAHQMPPCLIKKSDGSTLYATRDLATAEYRHKTFKPDWLVYVVGSEQILHFKQVFKVLELMGYAWAQNCVHVSFGLIKFPDGKMSSRKGNIVLLEKVLDEAESEAFKIVEQKNEERSPDKKLSPEEMADIAKKVGSGSVVFFDLKAKRMKDVLFDWKDILNFEGDSGPYLQYSVVRLNSLLERASREGTDKLDNASIVPETEEERYLIRKLIRFPAIVEYALRQFEPSILSHELLEIAAAFNRFYMAVPLFKGDPSLIAGRLKLVRLTRRALEDGLGLLGIQCPQRM